MGLKDLVITPIYFILLTVIAYFIRPHVTNAKTRKYFLPALWIRYIAAIGIGLLYQFYYSGGDTYFYFYHSGIIYDAFHEDFFKGLSLLLKTKEAPSFAYSFYSKMFWYQDSSSYAVAQVASVFDLVTFHTYSATALFFALFSFSGSWFLFSCVTRIYPRDLKFLALVILFLPSTIIWGSGVLKDSLTLGASYWYMGLLIMYSKLGLAEIKFYHVLILGGSILLLVIVKVYIVILLIIPTLLVLYSKFGNTVSSPLLRALIFPIMLVVLLVVAFYGYKYLAPSNSKYSLDNIAATTKIVSDDIRYLTGRNAGSRYSLGVLDGSFDSMIRLAPQSIFASLFRPFIWEVRNPLMLFASFEAFLIVILSTRGLLNGNFTRNLGDPILFSCFLFSFVFAFSVGFTYNFGTLMRYRIPLLVFYLMPFIIRSQKSKKANLDI